MRAAATAAFVAVLGAAGTAAADNLVQNGDFTSLTGGPANNFIGYAGYPQLTNWSYDAAPRPNAAVYTFAGADSFPGAQQGPNASFPLYGPGTGYSNGFVAPPGGGNILASDGEPLYQGTINQIISGLTRGDTYKLQFVWAGNEFLDSSSLTYNGPLTIDWQVSLGAQTFTTPTATYAAHGFTGWMTQTFFYTATSTSETLSFLAQGTPDGLPPTALLAGVSLDVPEPASWSLVMLGVAGLGAFARKRRRAAAASGGLVGN
jgi:hypothetical protein